MLSPFRHTEAVNAYRKSGNSAEHVQAIANPESPKTTKLCDRPIEQIDLEEIKRIWILGAAASTTQPTSKSIVDDSVLRRMKHRSIRPEARDDIWPAMPFRGGFAPLRQSLLQTIHGQPRATRVACDIARCGLH